MRIALLQCEPQSRGKTEALAGLERTALAAAAGGARLLMTPEMYLSGYNIGAEAARAAAESRDGPSLQAARAIARRIGIAVLMGFPERAQDGAVYNSVQLIGPDGVARASYRKTHLYGAVDRAQFAAGAALRQPVLLEEWPVGLAICYDIEFPEVPRRLALAGAQAILVPTANMTPFESVALRLVPARAEENAVHVAYANYVGREGAFHYCGLSCVCGPDGADLARAGRGTELLFAELSKQQLAETRARSTHLEDLRPDLYHAPLDSGEAQ